ncbi:MAG: T9SS type A sorting domain-containing protein [Melioribacteraceae bacterium]|nr:T9SS type A sorting domain-containing protein [Melioribacteraceae bacterium]
MYDILGREIITLVNQFQNAGRYTIDFNADGLSSGIYFYRLISDQFSETRKLILLR